MAQRPLVICPVSGATTVIFCAVSLITVCICFSLLRLQSEQINELRNDLMALKMNVEKADIIKRSAYCSGVDAKGQSASRGRRETSKRGRKQRQTQKRKRQCASVGRRTFLHLRASSFVSYDKDDYTAIQWTAAGSQGEGLEVSGETVTVATEGPYFIYSQVLYKGTTWSMGHVITKRPNGTEHSNGTNIMMCAKNMPDNSKIKALNSCYTAGIFFLESGTVLELYVPRKSAELDRRSHATFFGISSLWQ
ncbi:tumor necrosis factor ligand superfamily member 13 isoform X1 [Sardina pilchardus]|uniref:tumor necrosis factor ligand superfamily member 13 isoform X1 n=1 Tax=Sardina pilchardus TaxID=27697 RepID=UPI002E1012B8